MVRGRKGIKVNDKRKERDKKIERRRLFWRIVKEMNESMHHMTD